MERNQIKICSDPYREHNNYYWYEEDGKWNDMEKMDDSPLNTDQFIKSSVSHNAYDMLRVIVKKLYNPTVGIRIIFEGTDEDYQYLSSIKEHYYKEYNIELIRGTRKLKSAKEVMLQIEDIFEKLKKYFQKYPDKKTEAIIAQYTETVKPEIAICVMGLYSSGKSAFINSIIGQEILPSESDPTTSKIYKIRNSEKLEVVFKYNDENYRIEFDDIKWKVNKNPNSEIVRQIKETIKTHSPESQEQFLYWTLFALNDFARREGKERHEKLITCAEKLLENDELENTASDEKKIEKLLNRYCIKELVEKEELPSNKLGDVIEVYVNFVHSYLPLDKFRFVIYDTPGSNSVMFREHADILKESLSQQTNGLPVFITTPDRMDGTDNRDIMTIINEWGGALNTSNMILVVNKADEKSIKTLQNKNENKNNLVVTKWMENRVYFVSSVMGLGGKKNKPEDEDNWLDEDYSTIFYEKMRKFSDPKDKRYVRLFDYNILPEDENERIRKKVENINKSDLLLWNSGIPCVEEEIGMFAQKYALCNKCAQAVQYLKKATEIVEKEMDEAEKKSQKLLSSIEKKLDKEKEELIQKLRNECKKKKSKFCNNFVSEVVNESVYRYFDKDRIKRIVDDAYILSRGNNDYQKLRPFNIRIEDKLQEDMRSYSKVTSSKIEDYWKKCAEELRNALMKIVIESSDLTADQKKILQGVVLKVKMMSDSHIALDIVNTPAVKNKNKKLLWIFDMTHIDKKEAVDQYRESLRSDIGRNNKQVIEENERLFSKWIEQLIDKLAIEVFSFNPDLIELSEKCKREKSILNEKVQEKSFITKEINNIECLLEFEEVNE